jgi:hypothetical protein
MTEVEWLASMNPHAMFSFLKGRVYDRKLRLFACASVRATTFRSEVEGWVQVAEQFADGLIGQDELVSAQGRRAPMFSPAILVGWVLSSELSEACDWILPRLGIETIIAPILQDIFGNPFRPVAFDPEWRTATAVSLARQMYEARDFGAMPILADALQDAGCDSADILEHCRALHATHVRGCWVVDLVVGRE